MGLFKCEKCGCIENTAVCFYWHRKYHGEPLLCSECDPEIGKWHNHFRKESAENMIVGENGLLTGERKKN